MHDTEHPVFSELLRRFRFQAKLTQEALAERAGLSVRGIQDLERGVTHPLQDTVRRLATALSLSGADRALFDEAGMRAPRPHFGTTTAHRTDPLHNLPASLTSFVGREREIEDVTRLLGDNRLLTLTGSGGCGKSRLALQVAWKMLEHEHGHAAEPASVASPRVLRSFAHGVWHVDLAPLADPALAPQLLASVLHVREGQGRAVTENVAALLRSQHALLLFDNCEHLVDACASLIDTLLHACPRVHIMTTSRHVLGVNGERVWRVPSLTAPPEPSAAHRRGASPSGGEVSDPTRYESVRLFVDRALAIQPSFVVTAENTPALGQVCRRLDGIPLAIELAAARANVLSVEQIAARLDDRFHLLTGGGRTTLPRYQTLRATLEWSYHLLSETERTLLNRLSVFAGGWTLDAAEAICGGGRGAGIARSAVLDLMGRLVDKSLVVVGGPNLVSQVPSPGQDSAILDGQSSQSGLRYRLLETVRAYAAERLAASGEEANLRRRHRDWYMPLAQKRPVEPLGAATNEQLAAWLDGLEIEHDNFRAALHFSKRRGDTLQAVRLVEGLWPMWAIRGYLSEGRQQMEPLLADPRAAEGTVVRAHALRGAGRLALNHGDFAAGESWCRQSVAAFREAHDLDGLAMTLANLGSLIRERGDIGDARLILDESLAIARTLDSPVRIGDALTSLGLLALQVGEYDEAKEFLTESLSIHRGLGYAGGVTWSVARLGHVAHAQGDLAGARLHYRESLKAVRDVGDKRGAANMVVNLGMVEIDADDLGVAKTSLTEGIQISNELRDSAVLAMALDGCAGLAAAQARWDRAVRLASAAARLRDAIGASHARNLRDWIASRVARARDALGEDGFREAWTTGQAMTWEQAIAEALDERDAPER